MQSLQLNEVFEKKSVFNMLNYFLVHPTSEIHFNSLLRENVVAGTATLSNSLHILEKNELIKHNSIGNMNLYSLQREHPLVKELKKLNTIQELLPLREIGKKYGCKIYLYGSRARGEDTEQSDIDLLIISETDHLKIQEEIETLRAKKKIPINMISLQLFKTLQWAKMSERDSAFYERVEKDKLELI